MRVNRQFWLPLLTMLLPWSSLVADHCPDETIAPGNPDMVLAGINMSTAHIEDVIARYGPPSARNHEPVEGGPPGSGSADYAWQIGRATLTASTEFYRDESGKKIESVLVLRVHGPESSGRLQTGRGVGLGDPVAKVKSVYGSTYLDRTINAPRPSGTKVVYCYSDETELVFGIEQGRVSTIVLFISEE